MAELGTRIVADFFILLASTGVILITLQTIGTIIHRLYFHPLARFPGPKLNAISSLPGIRSLLKGRLPLDNKLLHDKYGPVVRVSPNELAFNSAQAWEDIYGFKTGGRKNMHKDPIHVGSVDPLPGASTLTMSDDNNHARQRRALSHSFSERALKEQEHIIQMYVDKLIQNLKRMAANDEEFNMVNWLNFTTFDIIGDLAFGEPFGCLDKGAFHSWVALIYETVKVGALEQATRRFAQAGSWMQTFLLNMIPDEVRKRRRDHLAFSKEKVLRRLANSETEHKDFIYYILGQKKKHDLHENEIILNGALFIVAGSETTANLLSGLIARLIWNPDKYKKLCDEIRCAFQHESEITYERTSRMPYLNACLEEGLRIHPPVPVGLLRTVPKEGDHIDGHWVPGGTSVAVGGWAASHNPANFAECDTFIPERWLGDGLAGDNKKGMQPFSLGPRGCIGKNLSYMEMRLILTRILWNFDIVSTDGAWQWNPDGEMKHMKAFNTWQKPDINAKVVPIRSNGLSDGGQQLYLRA
ncbi:cytochrome P450 [Aspergillus floccosus]